MIIYVITCGIYIIKLHNPYDCKAIFVVQRIILFLIVSISFTTLCLRKGKFEYLLYGLILILVMFFCMALTLLLYSYVDQVLLNNMFLLLAAGFIILCRLSINRAIKQFCIVIVSIAISLVIPYLIGHFRKLRQYTYIYAAFFLIPLFLVLLLG